ncbi:MAG TPA: DoxX family protein [Chitinophagaceae bacterium]|nr:DoxX family protein [Chitinophagaceae bacterium]
MIKYIFDPGNYPQVINIALLILRVSIGILMLSHGRDKVLKLFGPRPFQFADPMGVGTTASLSLAIFAEVFCSLLLILGMATRIALVPLIMTMLMAFFVIYKGEPFAKKELPLLYILIYVTLIIAGAGEFSVDSFIFGKL